MSKVEFEHVPYNENEKQQFALVVDYLNSTTKVIEFNSGKCELFSNSIMNPFEKTLEYEKLKQ